MAISVQTDSNNYKVLGILIRSERINKGFSLRDLGSLTNISHTLISNIENGKQSPAPDTLADIFRVLELDFHDDPKISLKLNTKSFEIYNYIFNQDYEIASTLMRELEAEEDIFLYSVGVVNYIVLKCFFYNITNASNATIVHMMEHYEKVIDFFTDDQKQVFYFTKGLYHLNHEHWNKATIWFEKALEMGDKELDVFIKEYQIVSLVRQFKFIDAYRYSLEVIKEFEDRTIYIRAMKTKLQVARIMYHIAKNEETEELVTYVHRFAVKFKITELIEDCEMLRAGINIRLERYDLAQEFINKIPNQNGVTTSLLKFKIAFVQNNLAEIEKLYREISKISEVTSHEKVWCFITMQAMSKVESIYNKDIYLEKITRLIEIASENNDQEIIGLAHNYLIMHYHEERSYKKALEIAEKLLHLKKIRIENK